MILIFVINFLLAISTTIAMTIIPLLTTETFGLSILMLAIMESSTELLSSALKIISGSLFDKIKNKKNIFISSTICALLSKILLFIPSSFALISTSLLDRISNGLFSSPRDAFIGHNTVNKGLALSLLNCSKTMGCTIGPIIVATTVLIFGEITNQLIKLICLSTVCTSGAVILSFFIKIYKRVATKENSNPKLCFIRIYRIIRSLRFILLIATCFSRV